MNEIHEGNMQLISGINRFKFHILISNLEMLDKY